MGLERTAANPARTTVPVNTWLPPPRQGGRVPPPRSGRRGSVGSWKPSNAETQQIEILRPTLRYAPSLQEILIAIPPKKDADLSEWLHSFLVRAL